MTRYIRQTTLPEIGEHGQARLSAAVVLVVGAGGLAATALPLLAGAGLKRLIIVDSDRVDLTNLHRQHLFVQTDCGQPKAEVAARRCHAINSDVQVTPLVSKLTPSNATKLVASADIVLDCADSFAVSYILSDLCQTTKVPLISASALGFGGYVGGFCGGSPSLRAVFPDAPQTGATCATAGVMGPTVSALGALQAQMALNCLLGLDPSPLGQMMQLDAKSFRFTGFRFDQAHEPDQHFGFLDQELMTAADTIIDLRPESEAPVLLHSNAQRITPDQLREQLTPHDGRLVLCCATGLRAWRAAENIHSFWPGEIALAAASAS